MIFVLILGSAVGAVAFAGVALAGNMANSQSRGQNGLQSKWALSGAVEFAKSDLMAKRIALGDSKSYTVAGISVDVQVEDNSTSMPNTVKMTLNSSFKGKALHDVEVVALAKPIITTIWSHGVFSNSSFTWPAASRVTGSVYFRNSISVSATGGQVTQDFKTTSMFNPMGLISVGGAILTGMQAYTFPTLTASTYTSKATSVLTGSQILSAYTFPTDNAIVVVNGNLTLNNAQFTRSGTIFVTGNVTVNRLFKTNPDDHILIVTPNNVTFSTTGSGTVTADAYFFSGGTIAINSPLVTNGGLIANSFSGNKSINITWDEWIMADPANGQTLLAPGL